MAEWICRNCNCIETDRTKLDIDNLGNAKHTIRCLTNVGPKCWKSGCTRPMGKHPQAQRHLVCDNCHAQWVNAHFEAWGLKKKSHED